MDNLNTFIWNAGGLNIPHKRTSVLGLLQRKGVDVALISETHLLKADIGRLANRFYHANNKTRGVAIVAKRNLNIKVLDVWADLTGQITIAKVEYSNRKIALISLYAPNTFNAEFYKTLTAVMLELPDFAFIVGGDFNAVWDPAIDRSGASETANQRQSSAALKAWAQDTGLVDLWCLVNPTSKDFPFSPPGIGPSLKLTSYSPLPVSLIVLMSPCCPWLCLIIKVFPSWPRLVN